MAVVLLAQNLLLALAAALLGLLAGILLTPLLADPGQALLGSAGSASPSPAGVALVVVVSAALPLPLLIGLRLVARRTRRTVLTSASLTVAAGARRSVAEVLRAE